MTIGSPKKAKINKNTDGLFLYTMMNGYQWNGIQVDDELLLLVKEAILTHFEQMAANEAVKLLTARNPDTIALLWHTTIVKLPTVGVEVLGSWESYTLGGDSVLGKAKLVSCGSRRSDDKWMFLSNESKWEYTSLPKYWTYMHRT